MLRDLDSLANVQPLILDLGVKHVRKALFDSSVLSILLQLTPKLLDPSKYVLLDPNVNKLGNIERCGNKMHQTVTNMILPKYLEL